MPTPTTTLTKKRPLPSSSSSTTLGKTGNPKKKQKRDKNAVSSSSSKSDAVNDHGNAANAFASIEELQWKEVPMPDRLDDVEGFFGLEEVEGVDVVKGERVGFRVVRPGEKGKGKGRGKGREKNEKGGEGVVGGGDWEEEEEWGGIRSEEEEGERVVVLKGILKKKKTEKVQGKQQKQGKQERKETSKKEKKVKVKVKQPVQVNGNASSTNSFSALPEDGEEDETPISDWLPLNLSSPTLRAISRLKFNTPTPIQAASIPLIIAGHDLIGKASTGSGKTLAFGIPILEQYLASNPPSPSSTIKSSMEPIPQKKTKDRLLIALIISPTRELAHQITQHIESISMYTDMRTVTLTGGLSLQKQLRQLESGVNVIVATPGRLWEVVSEGSGWLERVKRVKILVVDEADRVLQEGHFKEVEQVLDLMEKEGEGEESEEEGVYKKLPSMPVSKSKKKKEEEEADQDENDDNEDEKETEGDSEVLGDNTSKSTSKPKQKTHNKKPPYKRATRQTLVFSATFHKGLQQKLAGKLSEKNAKQWGGGDLMNTQESMIYLLKKLKFREKIPQWVDVNPVSSIAERVREGIVECGAMEKDLYLYYLLLRYPSRTLIFTNSITSVRRLTPMLTHLNFKAHPLHSQMIQKARLRSLERFSQNTPNTPQKPILIATDVAARGLDIKDIELIIHYHLPRTADMYVHRSGRTARGVNQVGVSVLLCSPEEVVPMGRLIGKVHASDPGKGYTVKSFDVDRTLAAKLKGRVELAKLIADNEGVKQKQGKEELWLKSAAEELGVNLDDVDLDSGKYGNKKKIRNKGLMGKKKAAEEDADEEGHSRARPEGGPTKAEIDGWKWELKQELGRRVNAGFSERYLTSGTVNLAQHLVEGGGHGELLGEEVKSVFEEAR